MDSVNVLWAGIETGKDKCDVEIIDIINKQLIFKKLSPAVARLRIMYWLMRSLRSKFGWSEVQPSEIS